MISSVADFEAGMRLHLGAFDQAIDGWVNTDITPHIWISRVPFLPFVLWRLNIMTSERWNQHHCGFTGSFLTKLFSDAGFSECSVEQFRTGKCPDIHLLDNRPEPIFFEAVK